MSILLLGANGQVGWELQRALACLGPLHVWDRQTADLSQPQTLPALIEPLKPRVIVNAAAYTAVDQAESDLEGARRINAESVAELARVAARLDAWLVHYSTDYVFDGSKSGPYREDDPTNPLSVYGQTKLEGELAIQQSGCRHLIFRTSWVYAARGNNFAKTMLRLAAERDVLRVVADQIGAPTSAELIADVTASILQRMRFDAALAARSSGIYHLVADGETSWHRYAQLAITQAREMGVNLKIRPEQIQPIASDEYPVPARRPANSRLDTQKLRAHFGMRLPHWQYHLKRMLAERLEGADTP